MRIALVFPTFTSIIILGRGFVKALADDLSNQVYTISKIECVLDELKLPRVTHFDVDMYRYSSPIKDLRYLRALYRIFRQEKIEVVINWTHKPNIYGTIAARLAGVKEIICAIRGLGLVFSSEPSSKIKILWGLLFSFYKVTGILSDKIWFTNPEDMRYFVENGLVGREKVLLTQNAINIDYFSKSAINPSRLAQLRQELGLNPQDRIVVMVGRMIWPKGIREYIEASHILKDKFPEVKFLLVGPLDEGTPLAVPESYLRDSEKAGNFRWLGFRRDVRELYALADLAVLPSYYKEGGFPRAVLEPMALEKPVITTDTPGCRAPVEHGKNGFLVPPRDVPAFAQAMERLLGDAELRKTFGKYSRWKVEQEYDEQIVIAKIIQEIYHLTQPDQARRNAAAIDPA